MTSLSAAAHNSELEPTRTAVQLSVVVPLYRSTRFVTELHRRLTATLSHLTDGRYEILFVDDGCPEGSGTCALTLAAQDGHVGVLTLPTNHGQHRAVLSGLRYARGRWIVVMDADLQDAPERIPELLRRGQCGFDVVYAGRRGRYESFFRLLTSKAFKWTLHLCCGVPADAGLFVALSQRVVSRLPTGDHRRAHVQVLVAGTGLPCASVPMVRARAADRGSTYDTRRRLRLAVEALGLVLLGAGRPRALIPTIRFLPPRGWEGHSAALPR